jgi:amino acid adenylation domain-containing protein
MAGTADAGGEAFLCSPQQRRALALRGVEALASALDRGWTLLRLPARVDAEDMRTALRAVVEDDIFHVDFVIPAFARTPFQVLLPENRARIAVVELSEAEVAPETIIERIEAETRDSAIVVAAARGADRHWMLLVGAPATHADLGSAFEIARRLLARLGKGSVDEPASYIDAADAMEELAGQATGRPRSGLGTRPASAWSDAPRDARMLSLSEGSIEGLMALGERLGVRWEAAALSAWTAVTRTRGDRSGACALSVDGRIGELATVIGPVAAGTAFAPPDPGGTDLRGLAALAHQAIEQACAEPFAPPEEGAVPPLWLHAFEVLNLTAAAGEVALLESTVTVEPALLTLRIVNGPGWSNLTLVYDGARIPAEDAEMAVERLRLIAAGCDVDLPLRRLSLAVEGDRILAGAVNDRAACDLVPGAIPARLIAIAAGNGHSVALAAGGTELTYAELVDKARRTAAVLASLGIAGGARVGVSLERGPALYETLCGILFAGASYVPIDPETPAARLAYMVADSRLDLLLASPAIGAAASGLEVRCLDAAELALAVAAAVPMDPLPEAPAPAPAYTIYTSGTTGRPKGVVVSHGALLNYAQAVADRLSIGPDVRMAALSTYAADLSYTALWGALLNGGTLVCLPAEAALDPARLADCLDATPIDWLKIVPAHFRALSSSADADIAQRLLPRTGIVFGGDVLTAALVRSLRESAPALRIVNHYGPTETTVGALACEIGEAVPEDQAAPIGTPLRNMRVQVVDDRLSEVDLGRDGMLVISGAGVANGYFGEPALTADRFRPERGGPAGARSYQSGDRVRRLPDGSVEFIGRLDDQLKIRGFRIEPQEVAAAVRALAGVRDVAVVADAGAQALLAFVVAPPGLIQVEKLRERLAGELPRHAVPRAIHVLRTLPLTRNGKIDRAALLEMATALADRRIVAPRNPVEARIAAIWSEALGTSEVGVDENFFQLGGHSLLATQILSRIRQQLRVEIPIPAFFAAPTIEGLAAQVAAGGSVEAIKLERREPDEPRRLSLGQERLWFLSRTGSDPAAYNNAYAMRVRGALDGDRLRRALNSVIARQAALRMGVAESDGVAQAIVVDDVELALPVEDLRSMAPEARERAVTERLRQAAARPFDLGAPPLMRATILRLADEEAVIGLVVHHLVWDGWSNAVFTHELFEAYRGAAGMSAAEPLDFDYFDYARSEREWAASGGLERQLGYWTSRLQDIPALELPLRTVRSGEAGGAELSFTLSADLSERLHAQALDHGATDFMVLLAAYFAALGTVSGQTAFAVGTSVANRWSPALEPLIGYFANQVPLCADLKGNPTVGDLLKRVRQCALDAFGAATVPFGTVVSRLRGRRDAARTPVFQTMFVQQGGAARAMAVGDLQVEPIPPGDVRARFDVTLYVGDLSGGLRATFLYDDNLLDRAVIERLREAFVAAVELIVTDLSAPLSQLLGQQPGAAAPAPARPQFAPSARRRAPSPSGAGE